MEDLDQRFHGDESETFLALASLPKIRPGAPLAVLLIVEPRLAIPSWRQVLAG